MARTLKVKCQYCGTEFLAQRSSARYCGANCRKAYSRIATKMKTSAEIAASELWKIDELSERYPDWRPYARTLFAFINQEVTELWESPKK